MNGSKRRVLGREHDGYTLVELLVAMLISSMVLAMAGAFFINVARLTNAAAASRNGMGQAALAIDAVRNVVTMAADNPTSQSATTPAVVAGTGTALTVISYANTISTSVSPSQVTFAVDGSGYLTETRLAGVIAANGYWAFSGTATSRRVAGPFVTSSGTPFFSFVDSTGSIITSGLTGLTASDLGKVSFVRVTAKVAATTAAGTADPVVVTSSVGLTNVYRDVDDAVILPSLVGGQ